MSGYLLDQAGEMIRRYVVVSEAQRDTLALWIAHTHAIEAADTTPYIAITSAEKRSGKSLLLELLELLVREPVPTANISTAALFRVVEDRQPTLLLDEVDAIFSPKSDREELRGLLNAGFRRGGFVYRMGGSRMTTLERFGVFSAKALAGIGELPDTIADRTVPIRLERRTRAEQIERFRRREAVPAAASLRDQLADWLEPQVDYLRGLRPHLPDELDDRSQDIWEPLLAIADIAGGHWPDRARAAALELSTGENRESDSLGARLLQDIYDVFHANGTKRYPTADLIAELAKIEESPWGDWFGKAISPQGLGKLLRPYRIKTMPVWAEGQKHRGYKIEQFEDAWNRVLTLEGGRCGRGGSDESASQNGPTTPTAPTAQERDEGIPVIGDDGYLDLVVAAYRDGHLTTMEALDRRRFHEFVCAGGNGNATSSEAAA